MHVKIQTPLCHKCIHPILQSINQFLESVNQSINQLEVHIENTQRIHIVEVIIDADIDSV